MFEPPEVNLWVKTGTLGMVCLLNEFPPKSRVSSMSFEPCVFSNIIDTTTANEVIMALYVEDKTLYASSEAITALTK